MRQSLGDKTLGDKALGDKTLGDKTLGGGFSSGRPSPRRRRHLGAWALVAWTVAIWGTRIRNIASDADLAGFELVWRTSLAVALTVFGIAGAISLATGTGVRGVIGGLGALTVFTWAVRGIAIAIADHELAFIVVHLVLAVVSIGLATWAWRSVNQPGTAKVTVPSSTSKFTRASS